MVLEAQRSGMLRRAGREEALSFARTASANCLPGAGSLPPIGPRATLPALPLLEIGTPSA